MSASEFNRDISAEAHARYIGTAILYLNPDGTWALGKAGQPVSEYQSIKVNGTAGLNDDTFEFTALTAETRSDGGFVVYLQSNEDPDVFYEANTDASGNFTGGKVLSQSDLYAAETRYGTDINDNGGLGDAMVLVDAGSVNLYVDGAGYYQIKQSDGTYKPLTLGDQALSLQLAEDYEIESVSETDSGYKLYAKRSDGAVVSASAEASGAINASSLDELDSSEVEEAEQNTGQDLNSKSDAPATSGWTSALKTSAVKAEVDAQTANGAKITHAGLVKIVDAAITSLGGSSNKVGANLFADLQAIAARGKELFTAKDLSGAESGYLTYVFDKLVNGSKANNFYTGGTTAQQSLGNLSADSTAAALQKLENKWLLGKDLPNPATEGDTANPAAVAASGTYKTFDAPLIVGGATTFDVNQGSAGTCYFLASLATIANVQRTVLDGTFVSNGTAADATQSWGVRFYDTKGNVNWVTANNQLVVKDPADTAAAYAKVMGVDAQGNPTPELWVALLEKAYAQANELQIFARDKPVNAMFAIEGGLAEALFNVTGGKVTTYADSVITYNENPILKTSVVPVGSTALAEYTKALNSGKVIFIVSQTKTQDANGATLFTSGHAYMAYDADTTSSSNTTVKVYNPWGYSTPNAENPNPTYIAPFDGDLATLVGVQGIDFWVGV